MRNSLQKSNGKKASGERASEWGGLKQIETKNDDNRKSIDCLRYEYIQQKLHSFACHQSVWFIFAIAFAIAFACIIRSE